MSWLKRPKPQPKTLGTTHLDTVLEPDDYVQGIGGAALLERGYPLERIAGRLEVRQWSPGNVIQTYITWDRGVVKRTYYSGVWRPWINIDGNPLS